jgi:hypothetical protein
VTAIDVPPRAWPAGDLDERSTLEGMLDWGRQTVLSKCAGLSDEDLRRRAVEPSTLCLIGIWRHLADCEAYWMVQVFLGIDGANLGLYDPGSTGADFDDVAEATATETSATFHRRVARSKEIAGAADLADISAGKLWDGRQVSLRWIYAHMIDEYARHGGHCDLLRERIDGQTGY